MSPQHATRTTASTAGAVAPDLRTRRRLETQEQIHRAAVELFEAHGVKATTVEEIAVRAGVSSRTFFRHFTSKEQAVLPAHRRLRHAIESLEVEGGSPMDALRAVEEMAVAVIEAEPREDLAAHQRVRRILQREPDVQGLATAQEQELVMLLRDRLLDDDAAGVDRVTARLIAETAMVLWRSSWEHWADLADAGETEPPVHLYRRYRDALRRLVA